MNMVAGRFLCWCFNIHVVYHEIEAILEGRKDRAKNGTVSHEAINWD